jgi:hypothetical protein
MELPISSERILTALKAKEASGEALYIYRPPAMADKIIDRAAELSSDAQIR